MGIRRVSSNLFFLLSFSRTRPHLSCSTCSQSIGSAAGPKLYLRFGWRASYGLHVGLGGLALLILFARGPNAKGRIGWGGNYSLSKTRDSDMNDAEEDVKDTEKDEGKLEDEERNEVEGNETIQTNR